jgi:rod shape-determining protein MreB
LAGFAGRDWAVDLGTSTTTIAVRGRGVLLEEPSLIAVSHADRRPVAVGAEAKRMLGRTPCHLEVVAPVQQGVIADVGLAEQMLRWFVSRVQSRRWARPRMVVCVPSGITGVEQRAVQEAVEAAGARRPVSLLDAPMAAAIGVGLPVNEPTGSMVVVVGAGRTEVAVISLGGIVASQSVRVGGHQVDEAIVAYAKRRWSLEIGQRTAEEIKIVMGTASSIDEEFSAEVRGRDLVSGLPRTVVASTADIREAIEEPVAFMVGAVRAALDDSPPELAADILSEGIALAGGGALLHGLDQRLADETGMTVTITGNPVHAVIIGATRCLDHLAECRDVFVGATGA